jgi:hypothetical protein
MLASTADKTCRPGISDPRPRRRTAARRKSCGRSDQGTVRVLQTRASALCRLRRPLPPRLARYVLSLYRLDISVRYIDRQVAV